MEDLFACTPLVLGGAFGSGKTEIALSLSLEALRRRGGEVVLVDLDLVTPFFRARDAAEILEGAGVKVLYPSGFPTGVDLPVLPPGVSEAIAFAEFAVLDVGGGRMGSRVLGGLASAVSDRGGCALAVVNPYRPMSSSPGAIAEGVKSLSADLRLPVAGVFANPNLGRSTGRDEVVQGLDVVRAGADELNLPIIALGIGEHLTVEGQVPGWALDAAGDAEVISVGHRLRLDWE